MRRLTLSEVLENFQYINRFLVYQIKKLEIFTWDRNSRLTHRNWMDRMKILPMSKMKKVKCHV